MQRGAFDDHTHSNDRARTEAKDKHLKALTEGNLCDLTQLAREGLLHEAVNLIFTEQLGVGV